jgi:hypothetical protein
MSKHIFVIYDKETTQILRISTRSGQTREWYYGVGAAKAALTRYCKQSGIAPTDEKYPLHKYAVVERSFYREHIEKQVKRKNLMTGEEYEESINTPLFMSPSSETYWSM